MKKQDVLFYCALAIIAVSFGIWLRARMSVPFTGFTGEFVCQDFGLPDKDYGVLRFNVNGDEQITIDALNKSSTFEVGRLVRQSSSLGRLELATSLVHSPTMPLNPLAEHFIEGDGNSISLVGRQGGKELYRHSCSR